MEDLIKQVRELETKTTELQTMSADRDFTLTVSNSQELKAILKLIDTKYRWESKNAALTVHVYDTLKTAANDAVTTEEGLQLSLKATIMTGMYNILLNIEGSGVEQARSFIKILTNVGHQVSDAMNVLASDNQEIQGLHARIHELEQQIEQTNEISEQIEEEA
tara:strand:- start:898 stop:1386 length:489 start_codon:yes stop_codon:yes gene_type:complete